MAPPGLRADNDNMAPGDTAWWESYRDRLERVGEGEFVTERICDLENL